MNSDHRQRTAVFAFDLEREYEIARRYTPKGRPDLLTARLALADAIDAYRMDGKASPALINLCVDEATLSRHWKSFGYKRLGELALDGHEVALSKLNALLGSSDALVRRASFVLAAVRAYDRATILKIAGNMLSDRSQAVRKAVAKEAVLQDWFELADEIRARIDDTATRKGKEEMLFSWMHLTDNERTGHRGGYRYIGDDRWEAAKSEIPGQP